MKNLLLLIAVTSSLNIIAQVPNYVPTDSLVAWYGFNGNANDESVNTNDGTVNGATLTSDRFGNANAAFDFDGNDDIACGNDASLQIETGTIQAWIASNNAGGLLAVLNKRGNYNIYFEDNEFGIYQYDGGSGVFKGSGVFINDSDWHHLLITFQSNVVNGTRFYFDGAPVKDTTWNTRDHLYDLTAGNHPPFSQFFQGVIDDIGIWSRALTECEVQGLYNAGLGTTASVTQTGAMLNAAQTGAVYQWLDCNDNNAIINGETNQSYTPTVTGNYSVAVNMHGCVDTSTCYLVDYTGLSELYSEIVSIYPNPASNKITINGLNDLTDIKKIEITSITGAIVRKENITNSVIDISMLNSGMYLLFISHQNGFEKISFLKE